MIIRPFLTSTALLLIAALGAGTLWYVIDVAQVRAQTPALVAQALERARERNGVVEYSSLLAHRERMLIRVEDPAFRAHRGVDLDTPGAGWTTITQGLAKVLYFPDGFKPGFAKIRQTLLARYALHDQVSKDDQLTLLLTLSYLGHHNGAPVSGFAQAARAYYKRDFNDLTDREFLSLVAMLPAPNKLKPGTTTNATRIARIERYFAGDVVPAHFLDYEFEGSAPQMSVAARALRTLLRIVAS